MKGNYIVNYNPADLDQMERTLHKADKRLEKFASAISTGALSVTAFPITANNLYKNIEALDAAFKVNASCTGCGLCERLCPVSNINISKGADQQGQGEPEWLHHCEHCMACISWCPVKAIDYGDRTLSRRRYHNPQIKVDELIRQSNEKCPVRF